MAVVSYEPFAYRILLLGIGLVSAMR